MITDPYGIGVNSYNRIEVLINNRAHMPLNEWLIQLGEGWTACDNIGVYGAEVADAIASLDRQQLDLLMDDEERAFHRALPDRVKVWRGCYAFNADGLSWSLSREIAAGFTSLNRYHHSDLKPMLLEGWVSREEIVVKLGRYEQEIIAHTVDDVQSLLPA